MFLRDAGCGAFAIAGGGGGRLDHLIGVERLFDRPYFPAAWFSAGWDVYALDACTPCAPAALNFAVAAGSLVSVLPSGEGPWKAESAGLKWPLDAAPWSRNFYGLSNVSISGAFSVSVSSGRFIVMMPA
jgi:thiamine pyrophosphokinase